MPNLALELHDSTLQAVRWSGEDALLTMQVVVHRSAGEPGRDDGELWLQGATLRLARAVVVEQPAPGPLWILDGEVRLGALRWSNTVPLPCDARGEVEVQLSGARGTWRACAAGLAVALEGEPGPARRFSQDPAGPA